MFFIANGAKQLFAVGEQNIAYTLKKQHPDYILAGERNEIMLEGFDYGNSPANIEHIDFTGKTVVHTTSAGTQGIANACYADEILTGSFVNALAISKYIKKTKCFCGKSCLYGQSSTFSYRRRHFIVQNI